MRELIKTRIQQSIDTKQLILTDESLIAKIEQLADILVKRIKEGASVYFCGNGGSAADAQHLSAELSGKFYFDRDPISSEALHCNSSFLTAVANDYSYDIIFARMLKALGRKNDILIGLSTSGNSKNIVAAFEQAKKMNVYTIAFTGKSGGKMKEIADCALCVPSEDTPRIQESHIMLGHILCELVESALFAKTDKK